MSSDIQQLEWFITDDGVYINSRQVCRWYWRDFRTPVPNHYERCERFVRLHFSDGTELELSPKDSVEWEVIFEVQS